MSCFCQASLNGLMSSLGRIPPLGDVVPPVSADLVTALGVPPMGLTATGTLQAVAMANLSVMASLSAAMQAAIGMTLAAALSAHASAATQASLGAAINSFNVNVGAVQRGTGLIVRLASQLADLCNLSGAVMAIRAALRLDMRTAGAVPALQARLAALASASGSTSASAAAAGQASATVSLLAALGFKADVSGVLAANAQASALATFTAGLPPIAVGALQPLAMLQAVLAMLNAIRLGLGIDLLAPTALADLRSVLSALPVQALAAMSQAVGATGSAVLAGSAAANANTTSRLAANAGAAASIAANAATALNLSGVATAQLSAAGPLAMLLDAMAKGGLAVPAGSCAMACPLTLLPKLPALTAASNGLRA